MIGRLLQSFRRASIDNMRRAMAPVVEDLEGRAMFSVTVTGSTVSVNGDDGGVVRDDAIVLRRNTNNPANLEVLVSGQLQLTRAISQISALNVRSGNGNDTLTIDNATGAISLPSAVPITFDGGADTNTVVIKGGFAASSGFFQSGTANGNAGDVSKTIDGHFQRLTFKRTQLVRELSGAAKFLFVGVADATEKVTLDNGSNQSDGILRITHTVPGRTFANVEFAKKEELILDTDQGSSGVLTSGPALSANSGANDTVILKNSETGTGLTKVTLKTHQGNDSVFLERQSAATTIDTGNGNDTVRLGASALLPAPGVTDDTPGPRILDTLTRDVRVIDTPDSSISGSIGSALQIDNLILDDTADSNDNIGTVTSSKVTGFGLGGTVTYADMESVSVLLGRGNDTMKVRSTADHVQYNFQMGSGSDLLRLGSRGETTERGNGTVNALLGKMSILGQGGFDTFVVDDSGQTSNRTATFSDTVNGIKLTGLMAEMAIREFELGQLMFGSGNDSVVSNVTQTQFLPQFIIDLGAGE